MSYTRRVLSSPALTNWGRNGCVVRPHSSLVWILRFSSYPALCPCVMIRLRVFQLSSVLMSNSKISLPLVPTNSWVPSMNSDLTHGALPS